LLLSEIPEKYLFDIFLEDWKLFRIHLYP
jgi:hypothetical protein